MQPGETIGSGAPSTCPTCGSVLKLEVIESRAGYYIGTWCKCGPYSRESGYYPTRKDADKAFDKGFIGRGGILYKRAGGAQGNA